MSVLTVKEKVARFHYELNLIKDKRIKVFAAKALTEIPDYFFTIPASSSGKYHPKHALGEGGLVRHTQCAVRIAKSLFEISNFNSKDEDLILTAVLLHDGCKKGLKNEDKHTNHAHPELMAAFLSSHEVLKNIITEEELAVICGAIKTHMGQWNYNKYSSVLLSIPKTTIERFVHMCDYLASRKFLNMDI